MTVAELIKELEAFDQSLEVLTIAERGEDVPNLSTDGRKVYIS